LALIESVAVQGSEVVARVRNGAAAVSPIAVALAGAELHVRSLTLRTPTLDDVFLELTGNRIQEKEQL
jgi:ABC-2 type transport system ATP-binding protein